MATDYTGAYGMAVAGIGDLDGDGRGEFMVGSPYERGENTLKSGRVYVYSGATGEILHRLEAPEPVAYAEFGAAVAVVPDADGDGRDDLVVGAHREEVEFDGTSRLYAGRAYLFSGATGAHLATLESPTSFSFGMAVAGLPDVDGDGRGDVAVGSPSERGVWDGADWETERNGRVYVFSGATGALLYILDTTTPERYGYFGMSLAALPDADEDGVADIAVAANNAGTDNSAGVHVFSGATGDLIRILQGPEHATRLDAIVSLHDASEPGPSILVVGDEGAPVIEGGTTVGFGKVHIFDAMTGTLIDAIANPDAKISDAQEFGAYVATVPDLDGDGSNEIVVGSMRHDNQDLYDAGRVYVFSGLSRALLYTLESPGAQESGLFGMSVGGIPDIDGDGYGDIITGTTSEGADLATGGVDGVAYVYAASRLAAGGEDAAPALPAWGPFSARIGSSFSITLPVTGHPAPAVTLADAPDGMHLARSSDSVQVTWTPPDTALGWRTFRITAQNDIDTVERTYEIWVSAYGWFSQTIESGTVTSTMFNDGFIGDYRGQGYGHGVQYNGRNALYSGSVLLALGPDRVTGTLYTPEFAIEGGVEGPEPSDLFEEGTAYRTTFSDARAKDPAGIVVEHRAHTDGTGGDYIVYDYLFRNEGSEDLSDVYVGLGMDWDVGQYDANLVRYDAGQKLLYALEEGGATDPAYYGVAALGEARVSGLGTMVGDDVDSTHYALLTQIAALPTEPGDIRPVLGTGPYDLPAGRSVRVQFAVAAGADEQALRTAIDHVHGNKSVGAGPGRASLPQAFRLHGAYPNPFNPSTQVTIDVPEAVHVRLQVYDALGRQVATLADAAVVPGTYRYRWEAAGRASGLYLVRMIAGSYVGVQRVVLVK